MLWQAPLAALAPRPRGRPLLHSLGGGSTSIAMSVGVLVELGCSCPCRDVGPSTAATLLEDAAAAVQRNFMEVEPGSIEFSLLALVEDAAPVEDAALASE